MQAPSAHIVRTSVPFPSPGLTRAVCSFLLECAPHCFSSFNHSPAGWGMNSAVGSDPCHLWGLGSGFLRGRLPPLDTSALEQVKQQLWANAPHSALQPHFFFSPLLMQGPPFFKSICQLHLPRPFLPNSTDGNGSYVAVLSPPTLQFQYHGLISYWPVGRTRLFTISCDPGTAAGKQRPTGMKPYGSVSFLFCRPVGYQHLPNLNFKETSALFFPSTVMYM